MARENDAADLYPDDPTNDAGSDPAAHLGKMATYLPFDRAVYTGGRVPCQALAALYYVTGASFHVVSDFGIKWSVTKKQIANLMERGHFIRVSATSSEAIDLSSMMSLEISCSAFIQDYDPMFTAPLDAGGLAQIIGPAAHHVPIKGRKRYYYPDGRVGAGLNLNKAPRPVAPDDATSPKVQEQMRRSDTVWDEAQARARGY